MSVDIKQIATNLLACAASWEPDVRLLGNVRADEIAALCRSVVEREWDSVGDDIKIPEDATVRSGPSAVAPAVEGASLTASLTDRGSGESVPFGGPPPWALAQMGPQHAVAAVPLPSVTVASNTFPSAHRPSDPSPIGVGAIVTMTSDALVEYRHRVGVVRELRGREARVELSGVLVDRWFYLDHLMLVPGEQRSNEAKAMTVSDHIRAAVTLMRGAKRGEVQAATKVDGGWAELTLPEHRERSDLRRTDNPIPAERPDMVKAAEAFIEEWAPDEDRLVGPLAEELNDAYNAGCRGRRVDYPIPPKELADLLVLASSWIAITAPNGTNICNRLRDAAARLCSDSPLPEVKP